jgi:lipopolysaccharide export system protein LptC
MKSRASHLFPVLLMLGLALLTVWLERLVQLPANQKDASLRHDPDFIVSNFTLVRMNPEGRPDSSLFAVKMVHFPDTETTELERPVFDQRSDTQPPIHIVSDRGTVTKDGDQVHLFDNVVVTRAAVDGRAELRLDTTFLEVRPNEKTARTDAPVVLVEGTSRLTGVGMDVNNTTREFRLHAQVRGAYFQNPAARP